MMMMHLDEEVIHRVLLIVLPIVVSLFISLLLPPDSLRWLGSSSVLR